MVALRLVLIVVLLALAACVSAPEREPRPPVILISIDGFRPDYLDRGVTPTLKRLAEVGTLGSMRPSFPSNTFPNHYTLVTGVRPDRHGIVDNSMDDPSIPGVRFSMGNKAAVADGRWWSDAVPIWVSAERAGVRAGIMFWPGSEAEIGGVRPSYWRAFDQTVPANLRTDQVLAWLDQPPDQRPGFLTLYFDEVDTAGHRGGPDSAAVNAALARTDAAVGRLVDGLKVRGIAANLVVVADHGMAPIARERVVWLDDLVAANAVDAPSLGAMAGLIPKPGQAEQVEAALLRPHPNMSCWRKGEIPPRFHYGAHRRVPPVVCLARTGWLIGTRARAATIPEAGGAHGFDPEDPLMAALFVAHGPDVARGRLQRFDNVEVYGLVMRLLRLPPRPEAARPTTASTALVR